MTPFRAAILLFWMAVFPPANSNAQSPPPPSPPPDSPTSPNTPNDVDGYVSKLRTANANTEREPAPAPVGGALEMLTPTDGVDFTAYLNHLLLVVKHNWYAKMPEGAKTGDKGKAVIRLRIQKDGTVLDPMPTVEGSSGNDALDNAAVSAIRASTPFEHLPESFKGPNIELRLTFLYNLPPSALHPQSDKPPTSR
jgi:TonB family protein